MLKISQIYGTFELDRLVGIFLLKIFFLHLISQEIHDEYTCNEALCNKYWYTICTFHILTQYEQETLSKKLHCIMISFQLQYKYIHLHNC